MDIASRALSFLLLLLPGLWVGFLVGRLGRKAISTALLIGAGLTLVMLVAGYFGAGLSGIAEWRRTASAWAGEQLTDTRQYLPSVLPTVGALGIGFKLGLGRR